MIALHERIKDTWYSSVVDECRAGDLREDTYNFIHGYPTSACGSSLLEQASSCDCQVVIDAGLDGLRRAWVQERKQNTTSCTTLCPDSATRIRNKVAKGFVPASTMHDSHTIGFVPVCRVTASTMQEGETLCKTSVCLEARALGGFSPQKKRKGLVQCQSLYMPRGQSPRRIQSTKETQKTKEAASSNNTYVCEVTSNPAT